jgi:hypothetical protein
MQKIQLGRRKKMPRIDRKKIKQRAVQMNDAWNEGAKTVEFKGHTQAELEAQMTEIESDENRRDDLLAQARLIDEGLDAKYGKLDDTMVDVRDGVVGHKDFGNDSPLYGTMGFVRKSERKSGLHRNKPNGGGIPS